MKKIFKNINLLLIAFLVLAPLSINYLTTIKQTSLHVDEYEFTRKSYFFDLYFVDIDLKNPQWNLDSAAQPKIGPYLFGLTLRLHGIEDIEKALNISGFNNPKYRSWRFWDKWEGTTLIDPDEEILPLANLILAGRKTSAIFTVGTLIMIFILGKILSGYLFATTSTLLLGLNTLMYQQGRRAMTDSMQLFSFFVNLLLLFFLIKTFKQKKANKTLIISILLGINLAFGVGVKVSAIMIYPLFLIILTALAFSEKLKKRWFYRVLASFLVTSGVFFFLFVILHPYLHQDALSNLLGMFTGRLEDASFHRTLFPEYAVYSRLSAAFLIFKQTLAPGAEFANFKYAPVPFDLMFFLSGLVLIIKKAFAEIKSKKITAEFLLLAWTIVVFTSLTLYLKNDWPRYYLPAISVVTLVQGYFLVWITNLIITRIKKEKTGFMNFISQVKKKLNKNRFTKMLVVFLSFLALIALSELIYRYRNRPEPTLSDYLQIAEESAQKSRVEKSILNLGRASNMMVKYQVAYAYPELSFNALFALPILPQNENLERDFSEYLKSIDYNDLLGSYATKWAKPYYKLGLLAFQNNEPDLVEPFWMRAIDLAPEWSYLHVELANFYLTQGKNNKANSAIEYCFTFEHPKDHCQQYLDNNIKSYSPEPVGTWEEKINEEI